MAVVFSSIPAGANGTALASIVPAVGTNFSNEATALATKEVQSAELYTVPTASFDVGMVSCNTAAAVGNKMKTSATIRFGATAANSFHGVMTNYDGGGNSYHVETNQYAGPGLVLKRRAAGAQTDLATYTWTPANNTSYTLSLENDGTGNLIVKLDGATVLTFNDTANNRTGGRGALRCEQSGTTVPMAFFSNIVVDNLTLAKTVPPYFF